MIDREELEIEFLSVRLNQLEMPKHYRFFIRSQYSVGGYRIGTQTLVLSRLYGLPPRKARRARRRGRPTNYWSTIYQRAIASTPVGILNREELIVLIGKRWLDLARKEYHEDWHTG